jgi:ATP-dependent protease ClpP protease subunit
VVKTIDILGVVGREITLANIQRQVTGEETEIVLKINSPGGNVFEGYAIYHFLKNLEANITAHVESYAGSIATIISFAAPKERRLMRASLSRFFVHEPNLETSGTSAQLKEKAAKLDGILSEVVTLYANESGKSEDEIRVLLKDTKEMTYQEAFDYGFIGGAIPEKEGEKLLAYEELITMLNSKKQEMDKNENSLMKKLDAFLSRFSPKMLSASLADGGAVEIDAEIITESVGKSAKVGGENAPDGSHDISVGEIMYTIVVKDGLIESVEEKVVEEGEDLKAENEKLRAEIESLKADKQKMEVAEVEKETLKAEKTALEAKMKTIEAEKAVMLAEVEVFSKMVAGNGATPIKKVQTNSNEPVVAKRKAIW